MGADGGSIPDRRDLVKTKGKAEQTDKALLRELFFLCALSKRPLTKPVVLDPLGKLYNKDAVLEFFIDRSKYGDGDQICGYLKGVKDLLTLNLLANPTYSPPASSTTSSGPSRAPFACPLSLKEMSGSVPFIALRSCGCVFSDAAIRAVVPTLSKGVGAKALPKEVRDEVKDDAKPLAAGNGVVLDGQGKHVACPNCGKDFDPTAIDGILPINPSKEVQEVLLETLLVARASAKSSKKRKAAAAVAAVVAATEDGDPGATVSRQKREAGESAEPSAKHAKSDAGSGGGKPARTSGSASPAPGAGNGRGAAESIQTNNLHRSVHQKLAEQEQKRLAAQAGMSDAVKAMFKSNTADEPRKGTSNDFFTRTYTRYA